ncbi:MAG: hypothetical protein ACFFDT_30615 [Candidatus Hodarchaeota archaeon]
MTINDSEPFLLNILKNPRFLEPVYYYILQNNPKTIEEITQETVLPPKLMIDEIIPTLTILNLVEKSHDVYRVLRPQILPPRLLNSRKFFVNLSILHRLSKKAKDERGWKKQAVYFLLYRYFVDKRLKIFKSNDGILIEHLNSWFKERGYVPRSARETRILLNPQKFDNWIKLAQYCGIVAKLANGNFLVSIDPYLFFEIMKIFEKTQRIGAPCSFLDFLKWIDTNFLPAYKGLTDTSEIVPNPYSYVVASLVDFGMIKLMIHGDYQRFKIAEPRLSGRLPNTFSAYRCLK